MGGKVTDIMCKWCGGTFSSSNWRRVSYVSDYRAHVNTCSERIRNMMVDDVDPASRDCYICDANEGCNRLEVKHSKQPGALGELARQEPEHVDPASREEALYKFSQSLSRLRDTIQETTKRPAEDPQPELPGLEATLRERNARYGDWPDQAQIIEDMVAALEVWPGWKRMKAYQREGIRHIVDKIARSVSGDPNYIDHWHDMAGYASVVERFMIAEQDNRLASFGNASGPIEVGKGDHETDTDAYYRQIMAEASKAQG